MPRLHVRGLEDRTAPAAGDLDPSFGTAGRVSFNASQTATRNDEIAAVALRPDGRIAVAGFGNIDFGTGPGEDFLVAQFTPEGKFDSTFNFTGLRFINFGGAVNTADRANAVAYLPDGRVLLAGYTQTALNGKDFALARLTPGGVPDSSFGTGGLVTFGFDLGGSKDDVALGLFVQPDGRVVVAGSAATAAAGTDMAVARLTPDGKLDTTFSGDGKATAAAFGAAAKDDAATAVAVRPDGRVVLGGFTTQDALGNTDFAVAQLTAGGLPDTAFNSTGVRVVAFDLGGTKADRANALVLPADGRIILAGSAQTAANGTDFAVASVVPDGTQLDTSFDADGRATVGFDLGGTNDDVATAVGLQAGGRIVLAGWATVGAAGGADFAVAQLTAAGKPDLAFGGDGQTTVAFDLGGAGTDKAGGAAVQPDGRIVLAGTVTAAVPANGTDVGLARVIGRVPFAPVVLGVTDDTGISTSDAVTSDTTPLIRGTAEPGLEVRVSRVGAGELGSTVADAAGNWAFGVTVPEGVFQFTAAARDPSGTTSPASNALTVIVDATGPSAVAAQAAGQPDPTVGGPAVFTVTFSEPTFGFGPEDVTLAGTAGATTAVVTNPSGDERTYTVTVTGAARSGTIALLVPANGATDAAGNPNLTATLADAVVTFLFPPTLVGFKQFAVGMDAGGGAARLYDPDRTERFALPPFGPTYTGGVRVAAADFTGDGVADLVTGTGPGSATHVRVFDGATQQELFATDPFEASFTGGVFVAAGDVTGDGVADLVISPDEGGGPRVRVFSGKGFAQVADFFGIEDTAFRGGARAAVGDISGDGFADLVVAAGFGGGPRVAAFSGASLGTGPVKLFGDFLAFEPALRNGTFVAAGDLNGDGKADLVAGGGPGGGPRVTVFDGADLLANKQTRTTDFFADDTANRGGIRLAVKDLDGDGKADLVTGVGTGAGNRVNGYTGAGLTGGSPAVAFALDAFPGFAGGVFVG